MRQPVKWPFAKRAMRRTPPNAPGERGFALLIVLWSLVLVSLLTAQILAAGRHAMALAANLRDGAEAQARADGAINVALYHLLAGGADHWSPDGAFHAVTGGGMTVSVQIRLLDDKINPNLASSALLFGLFQACGATRTQSVQLADAIIQWRSQAVSQHAEQLALDNYRQAGLRFGPPGRAFTDLGELSYVAGMRPDLLAAALPYMSLYQQVDPDKDDSGTVVRQALALSGQPGSNPQVYDDAPPVVVITAAVEGPAEAAVKREAVIGIGMSGQPYQLLSLKTVPY